MFQRLVLQGFFLSAPRTFATCFAVTIVLGFTAPHAPAETATPPSSNTAQIPPAIKDEMQRLTELFRSMGEPPAAAKDLVFWLNQNSQALPSVMLFEMARRLFDQSPADALEWLAIGRARIVYDARRCTDPSAGAGLGFFIGRMAGQPLIAYLRDHPDEYAAAEERALARSDLFSDAGPSICGNGLGDYWQALNGTQPQQSGLKPREQWPALQEGIRDDLANAVKQTLAARAAKNALPAGTIELRPQKGVPFALAWSADGKDLAMTLNGDSHLLIWDVATKSVVHEIALGTMTTDDIAFAAGDRQIVTASRSLDVATGSVFQRYGQIGSPPASAVDNAGNVIAYLGRDNSRNSLPQVILANLDDPAASMPSISVEKGVPSALAFGPEHTLAVGTLSGIIYLFDAKTGTPVGKIEGFDNDWVESLAISPDGHHLAAGSQGGKTGFRDKDGQFRMVDHRETFKVWAIPDGTLVVSCSELLKDIGVTVRSVAWSADNRHVAFTGYQKVHVLDIDAPTHPSVLMQFARGSAQYSRESLAFSPDGKQLAMAGDNVAFVTPMSGQSISAVPENATCH